MELTMEVQAIAHLLKELRDETLKNGKGFKISGMIDKYKELYPSVINKGTERHVIAVLKSGLLPLKLHGSLKNEWYSWEDEKGNPGPETNAKTAGRAIYIKPSYTLNKKCWSDL